MAPATPSAGSTYTGDNGRVGGTNVFTMRAKLLWQPIDNFKTQFTYERLVDRSQSPGAINVTPTYVDPTTGLSLLRVRCCSACRVISRAILSTRRV